MTSMRMWLVSGTFMAGVGTAMLCGAGLASADTGVDTGTAAPAPRAAASAPAAATSAQPQPGARLRHPAAAAAGIVSHAAAASTGSTASAAQTSATAAVTRPTPGSGRPSRRLATPVPAPKPVVPSPDAVDPAQFAGTYYEQGSVKQFFSIGLVNTKAVYTLNPDGTIRVQNSGNYFFNGGPQSSIVGLQLGHRQRPQRIQRLHPHPEQKPCAAGLSATRRTGTRPRCTGSHHPDNPVQPVSSQTWAADRLSAGFWPISSGSVCVNATR